MSNLTEFVKVVVPSWWIWFTFDLHVLITNAENDGLCSFLQGFYLGDGINPTTGIHFQFFMLIVRRWQILIDFLIFWRFLKIKVLNIWSNA